MLKWFRSILLLTHFLSLHGTLLGGKKSKSFNAFLRRILLIKIDFRPEDIPVYNLTIPECYRYSWGTLLDLGRKTILAYPFDAGIWYPGGDITTNKAFHYTRVFLTQWVPAYLVDALCGLVGRKKL